MIEVAVLLAVLAVIAAAALTALRPGDARAEARVVQQLLVSARLAAMAGEAQAVVWEEARRRFVRRAAQLPASACSEGRVRASHTVAAGVRVEAALRDDVVWLPDGTGRTCTGGGVYGGRVTLADRDAAWSLVVSSMGRIRRERVR